MTIAQITNETREEHEYLAGMSYAYTNNQCEKILWITESELEDLIDDGVLSDELLYFIQESVKNDINFFIM